MASVFNSVLQVFPVGTCKQMTIQWGFLDFLVAQVIVKSD